MNAIKFVTRLRDEHSVLENINGYLFGVKAATINFEQGSIVN